MLFACLVITCGPARSWAAQCSDGLDNDLDGPADYPADPGCSDASDNDEFNSSPPPEGTVRAGGLLWYPRPSQGAQLLQNVGFEETSGNGAAPALWEDNGFEIDEHVSRTGSKSIRLKDAHLLRYGQRATNAFFLKRGVYRISGWVKTENLAAGQGRGVRLCLSAKWPWGDNRGCTTLVKGTNDWQLLEKNGIVITEDINMEFVLEAYGEPDGTAWFDDLELREDLAFPLDVFLLYPNYRGMLFDDQSQTMRFDVRCNLAPEALSDYSFELKVVDESQGTALMALTRPAGNFVAEIDGSPLPVGGSYLARFQLLRSGEVVYEYPSYRIVKLSGGLRSSMSLAFDEHNRYVIQGKPVFLLGVYDGGLGYVLPETTWHDQIFGRSRRLFELPVNIYLNDWYGPTPAPHLKAMMNVLQSRQIAFLQTGNCFQNSFNPKSFPIHRDDDYVKEIAPHKGLAGFYVMDECTAELAAEVFERTKRLRQLDPDGVTFGASNLPTELPAWRDTIDALSTDPYPLHGPQPPQGYNLGLVSDWTAQARAAVNGSRPISTVLQFFQFTSDSKWPTADQLRNMSYMAIAEGANGLFYWSLGVRALAWSCQSSAEWCEERVRRFEDLKTVMNELKSLEPVLVSLDRPDLLSANSNPGAIRTRVKFQAGLAYLIASNVSGKPVTATFTWAQPVREVTLRGGRVENSATGFAAAFAPFEARVYAVSLDLDRLPRSRN